MVRFKLRRIVVVPAFAVAIFSAAAPFYVASQDEAGAVTFPTACANLIAASTNPDSLAGSQFYFRQRDPHDPLVTLSQTCAASHQR